MKQLGFSLIEVLLALAIFSAGLLASLKIEIQSERQANLSHSQILAALKAEYAGTLPKR